MTHWLGCSRCHETYEFNPRLRRCLRCGSPLLLHYELRIGVGELRRRFESRPHGVWRYLELLPELGAEALSLGEGGTFLQKARRLGEELGLQNLYLKNEATNPTGSFLDRGATIEVTGALSWGASYIACVARGNLAASLAAYSVKAGLPCRVYALAGAEQGKLLQALAYDAEVFLVRSVEEVLERVDEDCHLVESSSPLLLEGLKTSMLEILEELEWRPPDAVFLSVGSGGHMTATWKALSEARELGLIEEPLPRIYGAQTAGCAPLVEAFKRGVEEVGKAELCDAGFPDIADPKPALGFMALKAIRESGGAALSVEDSEVLEAVRLLAKTEGILAEPAAAVALAALRKAVEQGLIDRAERIVYIVTGSGLKDPSSLKNILTLQDASTRSVGETKLRILEVLLEGSQHGYGIWKELGRRYSLRISLPTVYQHLRELLSAELIASRPLEREKGRRVARRYFITRRGREALERLRRES